MRTPIKYRILDTLDRLAPVLAPITIIAFAVLAAEVALGFLFP